MSISPLAILAPQDTVTRNGIVHNDKKGDGTFEAMITTDDDSRTVARTVTYDDGKSKTSLRVVTINDDGSRSVTRTSVNGNGKMKTEEKTVSASVDGVRTSTGTITTSDGETIQVNGTSTKTNDGHERTSARTNEEGETATRTADVTRSGNERDVHVTGTHFNGKTYANEIDWTFNEGNGPAPAQA